MRGCEVGWIPPAGRATAPCRFPPVVRGAITVLAGADDGGRVPLASGRVQPFCTGTATCPSTRTPLRPARSALQRPRPSARRRPVVLRRSPADRTSSLGVRPLQRGRARAYRLRRVLLQLGRAATARPGPLGGGAGPACRLVGGASARCRIRRHSAGGTPPLPGTNRHRRQLGLALGDHKPMPKVLDILAAAS